MAMYMQSMQTVAYTAPSQADMPNMTPSYPSCGSWVVSQDQSCPSPNMGPQQMPPSPTMSPMQSPCNPSMQAQQWEMPKAMPAAMPAAMPEAGPTTVLLKGLPNGMCASSAYMEVVLDEAGLDGTIVDIKVTMGNPCGKAVIKFSNWNAAAHCIRHFSGCIWDEAGMPVSACFAKSKTSHSSISSSSKRESTSSEGTPVASVSSPPATPPAAARKGKEGARKTSVVNKIVNKPQLSPAEATTTTTRTLSKQNSNEDSDGSAGGSTRGSTRSTKSSIASMSPHSRPLWADIVSDDED